MLYYVFFCLFFIGVTPQDCEYRDIKCPSFSCKTSISLKVTFFYIIFSGFITDILTFFSVKWEVEKLKRC